MRIAKTLLGVLVIGAALCSAPALAFDGTKTEMPKWWIDGKEAEYYMSANEMLIPKALTQFARVEVGFTPYAGLGLQMPDGKGPKDDRVLSDMSIDDIAFSTQRIGCITQ
jgi:hypothetical protein